jgi:hypothetical protein
MQKQPSHSLTFRYKMPKQGTRKTETGRVIIPLKINLAGLTVRTVVDPELYKERKIIGEARYTQQQIALDGSDFAQGLMGTELLPRIGALDPLYNE